MVNEDEGHLEAQLRLANVLEEMGQKAEALEVLSAGVFTRSKYYQKPDRRSGTSPSSPRQKQTRRIQLGYGVTQQSGESCCSEAEQANP